MVVLSRQQFTTLWLGLAFIVAAYLWDTLFSNERNLERYKIEIEKNLHATELRADTLLADTAFHSRQLRGSIGNRFDRDLTKIDSLRQEAFNFCLFKDSNLVFWTQNDVLPLLSDFKQHQPIKTHTQFLQKKESLFELRYTHFNHEKTHYTAAILIPIKKVYSSFEGQYLSNHFVASESIPTDITLSDLSNTEKYAISTHENRTLCHLENTETTIDFIHDIGMVFCLFLGFFLLGIFGDHIAKQMLRQYTSPIYGTLFFLAMLVILRLTVMWLQHSNLLPYMDLLLGDQNNGTFVTSLAELLINTSFLFWLAIFFNSEFRLSFQNVQSVIERWIFVTVFYSVILLMLVLCIGIFNDLVRNWHNLLNFNDLSDFSTKSILALVGLGTLLLSVFLITHRLVLSIENLALKKWQYFVAFDVAVLVGVLAFESYELNLPTWMYIAFIVIYILMFHSFIRATRPGLIWMVIWLIIFSSIQSFFIARFNVGKDKDTLEDYARYLAEERDTVAEQRLRLLTDQLEKNSFIKTLSAAPMRMTVDPQKIDSIVKQYYNAEDYLSNQYSFTYFSFLRNSESLIQGDSLDISTLRKQYEMGKLVDQKGKVRFWTNKSGDFCYYSIATIQTEQDNPLYVAMKFKRQDKISSRVLNELFVEQHYKSLPRLNDYTYGIYKKGHCVEQNHAGVYNNVINDQDLPAPGTFEEYTIGTKDELIYQNTEGVVVKIGKHRSISSQGKMLTLYIILTLSGLLLLITAFNHFIPFLPEVINLRLNFSFNSSLRNRIVFPSVLFLLLSYCAIFYFTIEYFKNIDEKYYQIDVENKSNSIVDNVISKISEIDVNIDDKNATKLNPYLNQYAETYQNALHLYNTEGVLAATTEPNLFDKGIMSRQMNIAAYLNLKQNNNKIYTTDENIGDFHYKSSFYAVKNDSTKELLGFLEFPYYARDRSIRMGRSEAWNHNATVITLIFFFGICVLYIIAANTVKPLQQVADSLKRLSLGHKMENELITTWNKNDEISVLIDAYNNKVTELQESYNRLAEAEREMAWREMAKQVAHEIRNPLTPMKLSVQHLEMIRRYQKEHLEDYLARTNKILLDQIESLEKIVSEFASFAKMPQKANNELFVFNDLVFSVGGLFSQEKAGRKLEFSLSVAEERFVVYADRSLLTGALNNLIKNAIQAIPDDRDGAVSVSLFRRQNTAVVRISDNGTGIPKEIQDKIFVPNFTTKAYGSGIGLLITKNIIQSVNGKIYFQSTENEGTDFYIELEIQRIESDENDYDAIEVPMLNSGK